MINEEKLIRKFIGERVFYDEGGGGYIWGVADEGIQMIAQVDPEEDYVLSIRGWGAIQKMFKNYEEAEAFQNALGEWITDAINQKLKNEKVDE
jgi:hypothetical protein